ncbi:MAG: YeiH family protein [Jatrophihabitantaceae bacterium]
MPQPDQAISSITAATRVRRRTTAIAPGLAVAILLACVATAVGRLAPLLGAPVAGIVLGVLLSSSVGRHERLAAGIKFASKFVLQLAVVVLGSQLSLGQVAKVGGGSLPVMLGTLTVCLALAYWLGRRLGIATDLRTLIGVGTGICGASAIAAVSPVIKARSNDVAYAISTIFLFNVAAVLLFPPLGHALGLSQHEFGLFAGTAVNDTSSVVAAATTYGTDAGNYAVVVKLTRTLMIIPICLGLAALVRRRGDQIEAGSRPSVAARVLHLIPWFLIGFLLVAALNTVRVIPVSSHHALAQVSLFLITTALAGIGLSTDFAGLRRAGARPLALGAILWVAVATSSLLLQWAFG